MLQDQLNRAGLDANHLKDSLLKYNQLYNYHIAQKLLVHITPIHALKNWQNSPQYF